jgi:hypothetical protein
MMIGSYPYLLNPSGMGGVYAAAVATQPVDPVDPVQGQAASPPIQYGGALSGLQTAASSSSGQSASTPYTPGSTLDITV